MDKNVQGKLLEINQQFYDCFASSFSATRGRVQPGVHQFVNRMDQDSSILDIGCGNGSLARALNSRGFSGCYLGVDMSDDLVTKAEELLGIPSQGDFEFRRVDLADQDWGASLCATPYDWLVLFAVLHHLPGADFRTRTIKAFAELVSPQSLVAISVWQWQNSPRLRKRVLPWSTVGLAPEDLDEGDVLLDWRAGETIGLRYVHTFSEASLTALAEGAGFRVVKSFYSDGKTGDLALYQIWQLNK